MTKLTFRVVCSDDPLMDGNRLRSCRASNRVYTLEVEAAGPDGKTNLYGALAQFPREEVLYWFVCESDPNQLPQRAGTTYIDLR